MAGIDVEEVRRLLAAAEPLPWRLGYEEDGRCITDASGDGVASITFASGDTERLVALAPELASEVLSLRSEVAEAHKLTLRLTAERDEARLYAELRDSGESVEPPLWWEIRQEGA